MEFSYIWRCPNKGCNGVILLKTKRPYLQEGCIKCHVCGELLDFDFIMEKNKKK